MWWEAWGVCHFSQFLLVCNNRWVCVCVWERERKAEREKNTNVVCVSVLWSTLTVISPQVSLALLMFNPRNIVMSFSGEHYYQTQWKSCTLLAELLDRENWHANSVAHRFLGVKDVKTCSVGAHSSVSLNRLLCSTEGGRKYSKRCVFGHRLERFVCRPLIIQGIT